jgi:sulfatase maturation enzyme AslB (radical SAM superfamily)
MNISVMRNKKAIMRECSEKALKVDNLPFYYHIHIFMPCNERCIMCVPDGRHPKETVPFEKFVDFFEQIKPNAEHITLIGGEPLLYPWINEVIDLLSQHEIAVTINTNATTLDEKISEKLLTLHELNLQCSIDAITPLTYFKIRGRDWFERVKTNLERFSIMSKGKPNIKQILVYVVMKENLHEVLPFIDFAKTLSPFRVQFQPVRHVTNWVVDNKTGWVFDGKEQSCEFFPEEHNNMMRLAAEKCEKEGLNYNVLFV